LPSFLVVQTSFIGDMILTTPLLARLATEGSVDVVCTPAASALLANHPAVREVIVYDKRGKDRGVGGVARLAGKLRGRRYDAAFLAQGSVRSGALALAARIPERIGFSTSAGRAFYTRRVASREGEHHASRLLSLADRGVQVDAVARPRPTLYPGDGERAAADALLRSVASGEPIVALAPGSVWATKRWPSYADLARALAGEARIVVVGAEADRSLADEIADATGGRSIDATGRLSLLASAEVIGRASVLVTNDSAPLHLASAMNTPTLAVFGPTVPAFGFGPLAERAEVVEVKGLDCRPCDRHGPRRCPLGHWRCMREITAGEVAALVRALLVSSPRSS
jgi:heptosyltransferase-2